MGAKRLIISGMSWAVNAIHSPESNWFSAVGSVQQNQWGLSRNANRIKFRFFSEVLSGGIFEIPEPKTEPLHRPILGGLCLKMINY